MYPTHKCTQPNPFQNSNTYRFRVPAQYRKPFQDYRTTNYQITKFPQDEVSVDVVNVLEPNSTSLGRLDVFV